MIYSPDYCTPEPCENDGVCSVVGDSYSCDCTDTGYVGDECQTG